MFSFLNDFSSLQSIVTEICKFYDKNKQKIDEQENANTNNLNFYLIDNTWVAYNLSAYLLSQINPAIQCIWPQRPINKSPYHYLVAFCQKDQIDDVVKKNATYVDSEFRMRIYKTKISADGYKEWYSDNVQAVAQIAV